MEFGYFAMPSHPPERGLKAGHDFDLQTLRWLDELGFTEAWIGEHHTAPWEPHPGARPADRPGADQTKRLRIGPAASCCPTTTRPSWRTASPCSTTFGRAGSLRRRRSGLPSDWAMFNVDGMSAPTAT
jgi:hypothetical protein